MLHYFDAVGWEKGRASHMAMYWSGFVEVNVMVSIKEAVLHQALLILRWVNADR